MATTPAYTDLLTYGEVNAPEPKAHGWDSDLALDWARAQVTTPPPVVMQYLTFRQGFIDGTVTRTKAQRAFQRAFPAECTEAFDGICRCTNKVGVARR